MLSRLSLLEDAIAQEQYAVTDDAMLLCQADGIDALIEVGTIEFGVHVVSDRPPQAHYFNECGTRRWWVEF